MIYSKFSRFKTDYVQFHILYILNSCRIGIPVMISVVGVEFQCFECRKRFNHYLDPLQFLDINLC
jgi:hypothetical protein